MTNEEIEELRNKINRCSKEQQIKELHSIYKTYVYLLDNEGIPIIDSLRTKVPSELPYSDYKLLRKIFRKYSSKSHKRALNRLFSKYPNLKTKELDEIPNWSPVDQLSKEDYDLIKLGIKESMNPKNKIKTSKI